MFLVANVDELKESTEEEGDSGAVSYDELECSKSRVWIKSVSESLSVEEEISPPMLLIYEVVGRFVLLELSAVETFMAARDKEL